MIYRYQQKAESTAPSNFKRTKRLTPKFQIPNYQFHHNGITHFATSISPFFFTSAPLDVNNPLIGNDAGVLTARLS